MKDDQYEDDDIEYVSKSELKRDAERLKVMGKELSEMTPAKWAELPISENLRSALKESQRLKQNEAKRRHLQYIGKLMRDLEQVRGFCSDGSLVIELRRMEVSGTDDASINRIRSLRPSMKCTKSSSIIK